MLLRGLKRDWVPDPLTLDLVGFTPLHFASRRRDNEEIMKMLLDERPVNRPTAPIP